MKASTPCPDREKIFQLAHHLMEPEEEAAARRHLLSCPDCLRLAQEFEQLDAVLEEWKAEGASPGFDPRLKGKLPARRAWAFRFFALPSTRTLAAALLVLMVVAGAYVVNEYPRPGNRTKGVTEEAKVQPPPAPQPAQIQAPAPARTPAASKPLPPDEELKMYQNMGILENLDLLEDFDVLSELPKAGAKSEQ